MIKEFTIQLFSNIYFIKPPRQKFLQNFRYPSKGGEFYDADKISTIFIILKGLIKLKKCVEMLPA